MLNCQVRFQLTHNTTLDSVYLPPAFRKIAAFANA